MKVKFFIFFFVILFFKTTPILSQRIAYVDINYIFSQIDEYKEAQKKLDKASRDWSIKLNKLYASADKMYKEYKAEEALLTEEMKVLREKEIDDKKKEANEYQQLKFGIKGELFKKKKTLTKPIQDRIYDAIHAVAKSGKYDFIFDKSGAISILYSNPRYNKSLAVLRKLGYKNK